MANVVLICEKNECLSPCTCEYFIMIENNFAQSWPVSALYIIIISPARLCTDNYSLRADIL